MNQRIFISGLNELRCIAALLVILQHIEGYKNRASIPNIHNFPYIKSSGYHGVLLFFVLSGFLITYLSLHELKKNNSINVPYFYARRVLRIWPLYIICILIAYTLIPFAGLDQFFHFYFPNENNLIGTIAQTIFLPNYLLYTTGSILGISVLWSIIMEEQFYLVQPHLLNFFKKNTTRNLVILTIVLFIIRLCLYFVFKQWNRDEQIYFTLFRMLGFEPLLIGSIVASMYFNNEKYLQFFFKKSTQVITLLCLLITLYKKEFYHPITELVFGLFYAVIVINVVSPQNAILKINNKLMDFVGQISFGIYMLHSFILATVIYWSSQFISNSILANIC